MAVFSLDWYASIVGKTVNRAKERHLMHGPDVPFLWIVDPCQDRHICARYTKEA